MRAVWLTGFGGPEVLVPGEAPDPVAGEGQVMIDVAFANITFVETQLRAGRSPRAADGEAPPFIPGNGVGGVVASTGPGVDPGLLGRRVVSATGGSVGYAERVTASADAVLSVPDGLALDEAVALLADGRTAFGLLRAAEVGADDRVLVEAAAGGVGGLLVQLAARAGAHVIGAAGGERKRRVALERGAAEAVDYTEPDWAGRVGPVDVVFDGVGGAIGTAAFGLLRAGGRFLAHGAASGAMSALDTDEAARREVRVIGLHTLAWSPRDLVELSRSALDAAAAGELRPLIGQRFPLDRAAEAHAAIETRRGVGKTLLVVEPETDR